MLKKLSRYVVGASVTAAAMGMAGGASAQLVLGNTPTFNYAIELNYNTAATPPGPNPLTVPTSITTPLGFGVSSGQNRYIRYVVTGATFHNPVLSTMLQDQTVQTLTASANSGFGGNASLTDGVTVVSGGTAASNCVVFQVTGYTGSGGRGNSATDIILLDGGATGALVLDVPSNAAPVTLQYSLHETATSATCSGGTNAALLATPITGPVATFANSLTLASALSYTDTADVQFSGGPFEGWVQPASANGDEVTTLNAGLANIDFGITTPIPHLADGTTNITLAQLISAATLTVSASGGADFKAGAKTGTAITGVTIDNTSACGGTAIQGTVNAAGSAATFPVPLPGGIFGPIGGPQTLCYLVGGTIPIPAGSYTASVSMTPVAGVTLETLAPVPAGTIVHNGTVLQAPWFTTNANYVSRFFLTNDGTNDAPYTTTFLTEAGTTAAAGPAATGVVKAGSTLEIDATSLVTLTGVTRATVIFNVAGPNQNIQGAYNVVNPTTGSIGVSDMIRPGTN